MRRLTNDAAAQMFHEIDNQLSDASAEVYRLGAEAIDQLITNVRVELLRLKDGLLGP